MWYGGGLNSISGKVTLTRVVTLVSNSMEPNVTYTITCTIDIEIRMHDCVTGIFEK